jgi:hypothetical protein
LDPGIFLVGPIEGAMRSEEAGAGLTDPELVPTAAAVHRAWDLAEALAAEVTEADLEAEVAEAEEEDVAEVAADGADKQP